MGADRKKHREGLNFGTDVPVVHSQERLFFLFFMHNINIK